MHSRGESRITPELLVEQLTAYAALSKGSPSDRRAQERIDAALISGILSDTERRCVSAYFFDSLKVHPAQILEDFGLTVGDYYEIVMKALGKMVKFIYEAQLLEQQLNKHSRASSDDEEDADDTES